MARGSVTKGSYWVYLARHGATPGYGFAVAAQRSFVDQHFQFTVANVAPNGPAERNGLKVGDGVLEWTKHAFELKPSHRWDQRAVVTLPAPAVVAIRVFPKSLSAQRKKRINDVLKFKSKVKRKHFPDKAVEVFREYLLRGTGHAGEETPPLANLRHFPAASAGANASGGLEPEEPGEEDPMDVEGGGVEPEEEPTNRPGEKGPTDVASGAVEPTAATVRNAAVEPAKPVARDAVNLSPGTIVIKDDDNDQSVPLNQPEQFYTQQVGGPKVRHTVCPDWKAKLENNYWMNDEIVFALCSRFAQAVPYERVALVHPGVYNVGISPRLMVRLAAVPVKCFPVCVKSHWTLVIMVSHPGTETDTFVFDSKPELGVGMDAARHCATYFGAKLERIQRVAVRPQSSDFDCGDHVVWNFAHAMLVVFTTMPELISEKLPAICSYMKGGVFTRKVLANQMKDATDFGSGEWMFWCKYSDSDIVRAPRDRYWPCRVISRQLARFFDKGNTDKSKTPVVWIEREVGDLLWRQSKWLIPLQQMTVEQAMDRTGYFEYEESKSAHEGRVRSAYQKAMSRT